MLTLALLLLTGQVCQSGMTCTSNAFQPPCVSTTALGACTSSRKGTMRCVNDGLDGGVSNCWAYCNGSAWSCVGSGGASSVDTCTGNSCLIGPNSNYWDGGNPATTTSQRFVASGQFHGFCTDGVACTDGGYAIASYDCSGVGGDGLGNGQPCVGNSQGIVEIYGHVAPAQEAYGQTGDLCPIEMYDMGPATLLDGGPNVNSMVCIGHAGAGDKVWRIKRNGDVYMDGVQLRLRGPRSVIAAGPGTTNAGLELFGNILSGGGRGRAAMYVTNQNFLGPTDDVLQVIDTNNAGFMSVTTQGAIRLGSVASGAESTCPGASNLNLGQFEWNPTIDRSRLCTSTGWVSLSQPANIAGHFPGLATIAPADDIRIANQRMYVAGTMQRIGYNGLIAGTNGVGSNVYTIDVYDNTTSTVLCVTGNLACNIAGIGSVDCASAQYAQFDDLRIRVNCSGCATCPMTNVNAEYQ